jgi:tRNA(fMet)-specific endonuclease VapC
LTWLLDTNVLIHAQRGRPAAVARRLADTSPDDLVVSAITIAELWYGIAKSDDPPRKLELWRRFLEPFSIAAFDRAAAEQHGRIRLLLKHKPIGERDLLIAAIAMANGFTVVTSNTTEFSRVPDLATENWAT